MALKGLDIFKLTPKTNCKDCGSPTCMAFAMKVAQGAISISECPHMSAEALAKLSAATEPPMKTIEVGVGECAYKLGGETVMLRHEKTLVNQNLYGVFIAAKMQDAAIDALLAETKKVDYERISTRMYVECVLLECSANTARNIEVAKKVLGLGRELILKCADAEAAKAVVEATKEAKPVLCGANAANWEAMNAVAKTAGVVLGVSGADLNELHDTVEKLEAAGNRNLILDLGSASIKDAFANAVEIRRAALKNGDRTFGYPSIVNVAALAPGDIVTQAALASIFTLRYGSIIIMERIGYAEALPLFGLRQNIFTDPQKPMRVTPGIYPIGGANENSVCCLTVDFALTYFVVSGEIDRSHVPINLLIPDAGGYSVLTAWAAGKLSAASIAKFVQEFEIESKVKNHTLIMPGKVAVLQGALEDKLPGWKIVVGPNEAIQLVKFLKDFQ
jgi:acetyl-CoA decarbonylase/synthase complex subunit gamma